MKESWRQRGSLLSFEKELRPFVGFGFSPQGTPRREGYVIRSGHGRRPDTHKSERQLDQLFAAIKRLVACARHLC
jgi:hypothetical protein